MVKLLEASEIDTENEAVDAILTEEEESDAKRRFNRNESSEDLSDGGMVGGARISPMRGGKKVEKGRAAARRAWMWNGTETVLPLAWNPDGTVHDGARRYMLKRHCLCCNAGGFRGMQCPNCSKNQCTHCASGTDRKKIIPNFYLKKDNVPFPSRFFGSIPCFLSNCVRRDDRGFLTQEEMRIHARSRHRMEYQAYMETQAAERVDEVTILRQRLDAMMLAQTQAAPVVESITVSDRIAQPSPAQMRAAHARASKKVNTKSETA